MQLNLLSGQAVKAIWQKKFISTVISVNLIARFHMLSSDGPDTT